MAKIAIIISDFNSELTSVMLRTALKEAQKLGRHVQSVVHVPGCFETPLAVKRIISKVSAVVVLAAVVKGKTDHDEIVVETTARKLMDLSLEYNKPIGFGVIGPDASYAVAKKRVHEYAQRAVETVHKML